MGNLRNRIHEPSSWLGLGSLITGLGVMFEIGEAEQVSGVAGSVAQEVARGTPWWIWAPAAAGAIIGIFMKDPNNGRD